jgi:hypothetical protein
LDDQRKFLGLFGGLDTSPAQIEPQLDDIAKQVPRQKKKKLKTNDLSTA